MIDLRSDTVTRPSDGMRRAMAAAEVGDDVYREDPTVNRLQDRVAELFDAEASLFVPSGVMANQLWLRLLARPATEVILDGDSHIVNYEAGAGAALAGVQFRTLVGDRGRLSAEAVAEAIRPDAFHLTPTSLVSLEQTHNRHGGTVYRLEELAAVASVARGAGLNVYIDGARVFNALAALDAKPGDVMAHADGLSFCLSKGLGAPVGSMMVGSSAAIEEARLWRRRYGGALRQVGVLAAAGLHALDHNVERLAVDHANARLLASEIAGARPGSVDPDDVPTNILFVDTGGVDANAVVARLAADGVLANAMGPSVVRFVTHLDVDADDCRRAARAFVDATRGG